MKLTAILLLVACLISQEKGYAQNITINLKNATLEQVFKEIKRQTGYNFIYTREQLQQTTRVTLEMRNATLQQVLDRCFSQQPVTYTIQDKYIIIRARTGPISVSTLAAVDTVKPPRPVKVNGWVTDEDGAPLDGATICTNQSGKPASGAATSDEKGNFKIMDMEEGVYMLEISFIGYQKFKAQIKVSKNTLHIYAKLKQSVNTLDEIQTTAYSRTTKRFNTGDITTINAEEIAMNPVPNVLQALQGRVPGMFVYEVTGMANGAFQVQIRSLNTLYGQPPALPGLGAYTAQPLYILDEVEYPAGLMLPMANFPGYVPAQAYGNALNYLDPSQIASINVLKGADATAIYGSRGAFGVILITTKKAKAGKPSLTLNAAQGFTELGRSAKLMNTSQYLALRHNAFANDSTAPGPGDYDVNGTWDTTRSYDWKKFYLGSHAPTARVNASFTGGSDNSNFLIGANYSSIDNVQRRKGSVRAGGMNFSMNTATDDKKLTMALSGSYSNNLDDMVPVDFDGYTGVNQAPDAPWPYLPNGKLNFAKANNPAAAFNALYRNSTDNFFANTTLTFTPVKGLTLTAAGGYHLLSAKEFGAKPSSFFNPATFTPAETYSYINLYRIRTFSADPRAEFVHSLGTKGRLDITAGGSLRDLENQQDFTSGSGYASDQLLLNPSSATQANTGTYYNVTPNRYLGGFAILNFRWADKYIVDLNGRRDGSSIFGNDRQYGNFWSVAAAWIISEEPWFKGLHNVIDFLKVKGSYGLIGGSNLAPYQWLNTYSSTPNFYQGGLSLFPANPANPYLHWETDRNFEAGLNFDLWKGAVNVDATYYFDKAGDQVITQPLASITGFTSYSTNSPAVIHSYGTEFMIITQNIRQQDFSWTTRINLTIPRTKLVAYPGLSTLTNNINYTIGKPISGIKLVRYAGVDPATGVYNFYNAQGVKGEYTPFFSPVQLNNITDRTQFIDLAPKWYGGIGNTLTYKNISLDFFVTLIDRMGADYLGTQTFSPGFANTNFPLDLANRRWMKPGDITTVPKATAGVIGFLDQGTFQSSTGAYSNATYARLQNCSVSYKLPSKLVRQAHLASLSVYVAGQNLLTITKYKDLDPENLHATQLPPLRIFTGGLNVTF
jgi:TonB-dependent starch-binding outer membrane protein SusC